MWVSTFHSMCVRILRRNIDRIGISKSFSILDSADQLSVIKNVLKTLNLDAKQYEPRSMLNAISSAKNECIDAEMYRSANQSLTTLMKKRLQMSTMAMQNDYAKTNRSILTISS